MNRFYGKITDFSYQERGKLLDFSENYFIINVIINEKRRKFSSNKQMKVKSFRTGLNADLNFRKTSVDLLSTPYMQKCLKYGMS